MVVHLSSEAEAAKGGVKRATLHIYQRTLDLRLERSSCSMLLAAGSVDMVAGEQKGRKLSRTPDPVGVRSDRNHIVARKAYSGERLLRGTQRPDVTKGLGL